MGLLGDNTIIANIELRRRLYDDITSGTLAHAYIIEGKKGSGRHTLAKHIIAALACERKGETLPCGECLSCRHIFENKCPDVIILGKEDKSSVGIQAIRTLKSTISAVPNDLDFKAYIIEDADTLTMQAQNAFLLTLEQPPTAAFFFMLCENARSLLETIRSRAAILRTEPISHVDIGAFICSENVEKSIRDAARSFKNSQPNEFEGVLMAANGSIGRAIELLSPKTRQPIIARREFALKFIQSIKNNKSNENMFAIYPSLSSKRDELVTQLELIKLALRDLILLKKCETAPLCFFGDRNSALDRCSMFTERRLVEVFETIEETINSLQKNSNIRLTTIGMLSKL
jgi:DNA polymerase-3 subunit delta'